MIEISDFKEYFTREFTYGTTTDTVLDSDISRAITECYDLLNVNLYPTDEIQNRAALYLTAHLLTLNLDAVNNTDPKLMLSSASAGSVSYSNAIPDWMNNEDFSFFSTTFFGQKFLIISRPYLGGAVFCVNGGTN